MRSVVANALESSIGLSLSWNAVSADSTPPNHHRHDDSHRDNQHDQIVQPQSAPLAPADSACSLSNKRMSGENLSGYRLARFVDPLFDRYWSVRGGLVIFGLAKTRARRCEQC